MSTLRFKMVEESINKGSYEAESPAGRPSEYFGMNVFNKKKMKEYLPKNVYEALVNTMDNATPLPRQLADAVAAGMKQWAMDMGVTHYTNWFQPLTGGTAEKHDSFLEPDENGGGIEEFSGKLLFQQEPDASSFPSGGIRNTFEARGYSAWDATSPAFIVGDTLCIPTVFIAYTGEALDYKAPLLKSTKALSDIATEVCKYFGEDTKRVFSYLGWEQEYFLVDESLWAVRPDLILTGRTLIGHESAKNQQLEDHYFGAIPVRVRKFMEHLEYEAWKLGIPVHTRHNEVAPNQFECAPIYEEVNLANDHNQLLMSIMGETARKHGFHCLLHEKPFAGINGSGKHCNWSIGTDTGINLLSPGKTPEENIQFITFLVNILMAVYKNNGMLKACISSATNAHRLGANGAPPAIISVFLGDQLTKVLDKIEATEENNAIVFDGKKGFKLAGIDQIPELFLDNTDRNRTSPFAFTGNRFEFRAVGSSANCAGAMTGLNTAVTYELKEFKKTVDKMVEGGMETISAIYTVLRDRIKECKAIRFDGNGYGDEWKEEAEKRGLDCETSVPLIFDRFMSDQSVKVFTDAGILTRVELEARNEVNWETYTKKIQIEARLLGDLAQSYILPAASRYQELLLDKIDKMTRLFPNDVATLAQGDIEIIKKIATHINAIRDLSVKLVDARKVANKIKSTREKAVAYHDTVLPYFEVIRKHVDDLEVIVDNEMWPLPKYSELLFIR